MIHEDKDFEEYLKHFSPHALPEDMAVRAQRRRRIRVRRRQLHWSLAAACLVLLLLLNWAHRDYAGPDALQTVNAPALEPISRHALFHAYAVGGLDGLDDQLEQCGNALIPVKRDEYM